jgi:hypothetical protein
MEPSTVNWKPMSLVPPPAKLNVTPSSMVTPPLTLVSTEPWTEDKEILALPAARLPLTVALDPSAERFVE